MAACPQRRHHGHAQSVPHACGRPRAVARNCCQARRVLPAFSGLAWRFVRLASLASSPLLYVLRLAAPCALSALMWVRITLSTAVYVQKWPQVTSHRVAGKTRLQQADETRQRSARQSDRRFLAHTALNANLATSRVAGGAANDSVLLLLDIRGQRCRK